MRDHCLAVLLWGSQARGDAHPRSDIDLCIVAGPGHTAQEALHAALPAITADAVDVKVFETLPDHLQAEVIRDHQVLWCPDEPGLGEYLRPFWKRWRTQERRNRLTREEAREVLQYMAHR